MWKTEKTEKEKKLVLKEFLTIYHWYNFELPLFQQQCLMKYRPWWWVNLNINRRKSIQITELHIQSEAIQNEKGTNNSQQLKFCTPCDDVKRVSFRWCCKLSQQADRDKFPRSASNRKQPLGNTSPWLLLRHKQSAREKVSFLFTLLFTKFNEL